MKQFNDYMIEYRKQMGKGDIVEAYKGLMDYFQGLRVYLQKKYPEFYVSGNLYFGYMDMTYFSFFPNSLKRRKLKIGIVFIHDTCRFEVWLFGYNKRVQTKYCKLFTDNNWNKYHIAETTKGVDSILDHILVDTPDFSDLDTLTRQIEKGTLKFIKDVENFLSKH